MPTKGMAQRFRFFLSSRGAFFGAQAGGLLFFQLLQLMGKQYFAGKK
jgi:hypothetical protein